MAKVIINLPKTSTAEDVAQELKSAVYQIERLINNVTVSCKTKNQDITLTVNEL